MTSYYSNQQAEAERIRQEELAKRKAANAQSPSAFEIGTRAVAAGALAKFLFGNRGSR